MPGGSQVYTTLPVTYAVVGVEDRNAFFALFYGTESFAFFVRDDQFIT
ncbi:hypothetical protein NBRC116602_24230 [Hyphomicrobiales bacterium 4NK60-0047b]